MFKRVKKRKKGGNVLRKRGTNFTKNDREKLEKPERGNSDFSFTASRPVDRGGWNALETGVGFDGPRDLRARLENALVSCDPKHMRELSKQFFKASGVYSRTVRYLSWLPTYDSLVIPVVLKESVSKERIMSEMILATTFLDKLKLKTTLKEIALSVIRDGVYFGYLRSNSTNSVLQELPVDYCRTKYKLNGFPVVEFNVKYFDEKFPIQSVKIKVLNSFPKEVVEGYAEYKRGNVKEKFEGEGSYGAWVTMDPDKAIAFYFDDSLAPILSSAFFSIIDVLELKGAEKAKAEEQLFNLIVQKVPLTKDGDFIFDMNEAKAMHDNAAEIFRTTQKSDVLTTFGEIDKVNLNEKSPDPIDLAYWDKGVWGDLGVSSQLFSTEGNLALEKSIAVDESLMYFLVEKFEAWLNYQIDLRFNKTRTKYYFKVWFPPLTQNNRVAMSKHYKDLATLGYSKFLPTLALGEDQVTMMALATFENDTLNLNAVMEPLRSSHTASAKDGGKGGRPPKDDAEKSDKTIQNQNS